MYVLKATVGGHKVPYVRLAAVEQVTAHVNAIREPKVEGRLDNLPWGTQIWVTCEGKGKELGILEIALTKPTITAGNYVSPLETPDGMFPCPAQQDTPLKLDGDTNDYARMVVKMAQDGLRINARITGPQGTGKTTLANNIAKALDWDFVKIDVGGIREASDWFSRIIAENGSTKVVPTLFAHAVTKPQTVILLDELNRCPAEVHNAIYGILDEQAWTWDEDLRVKLVRAPRVLILATLNLAASNVGIFDADSALVDRFPYEIRMPMPDRATLALIMKTHTNFAEAEWLAEVADTVNGKTSLTHTVSIRALIAAATLINNGMGWFSAAKYTIAGTYSREGDGDSEFAIAVNLMKGLGTPQ